MLTLITGMALVNVAPAALAQDAFAQNDVFGGGGPTIGMWQPDFTGLNEALKSTNTAVHFDSPVVIVGGGGGATVGGFSVGGFGGGTYLKSDNVEFTLGFGGAEFMRTAGHWGGVWSYGALLGGGSGELFVTHETTADSTVGDEIDKPKFSMLSNDFLIVGPQMSFRTELTPFAHLRASAGYLFTAGGGWESADGQSLSGGDVDWSGPYVQFGIVFGASSSSLPFEADTDIN